MVLAGECYEESKKKKRRTELCIRYRFHGTRLYRFHLPVKGQSLSLMKKVVGCVPLNGHGPYTFSVGSIHNAGHNFSYMWSED